MDCAYLGGGGGADGWHTVIAHVRTFASIAEDLVSSALLKRMMNHATVGDATLGHYVAKSEASYVQAGRQLPTSSKRPRSCRRLNGVQPGLVPPVVGRVNVDSRPLCIGRNYA